MTVVGSFLINGVGNYYIEDFYVQMEKTFSTDFITQLQKLAAGDNGTGEMKQLVMSRSDLGIDPSQRNMYILEQGTGKVLESSNQQTSVAVTANILTAITAYCGSRVAVRTRDISICMNRLGYVQCRVGNLRGWNVVPLSGNDIHNNHCLNAHRSRPDSE
jgi:hypothetical protein